MANRHPLQPEPISREFNSAMVTAALKIATWQTLDLHDYSAVKERTQEYFTLCDEKGLRPSNLGYYAALGLSKQDVSDILRGANKSKVTPQCIDLIKKTKLALSAYREQLAITGKVSPPIAIFWAKNFDNMEDTARLDVSRSDPFSQTAAMTPEEVARELEKIEKDIPIDLPYY